MEKLPNFIFIGPDKSGSTWISKVLELHPEVFITPAKDLYFFDKYYNKGFNWYKKQFKGVSTEKIIAEVSHDYLFSKVACERIKKDLPNVKLMVSLREPVDRAHSAYLYLVRKGIFLGTFEEAMERFPKILDHGRYFSYLKPYLDLFSRDEIFVTSFDLLKKDPNQFAKNLFDYLEISQVNLSEDVLQKKLPAARSRSVMLTKFIAKGAITARNLGLAKLIGKIKSSDLIQSILYKPYDNDIPKINDATQEKLKEYFYFEVEELDKVLGTNYIDLWGYTQNTINKNEIK